VRGGRGQIFKTSISSPKNKIDWPCDYSNRRFFHEDSEYTFFSV
jgi:hypothetical protein